MNEKSLDVLCNYDIEVFNVSRGRGGMILTTDIGTVLFLECIHPDKYYEKENCITRAVADNGFMRVDTYINNKMGELITCDTDGRRYVVKNWFDGRECNIKDVSDLCAAVRTLAQLHIALDEASAYLNGEEQSIVTEKENDLRDTYLRHARELKMASNYLKNKKNRVEFELLAYRNIISFYDEAMDAVKRLNDDAINERFERARKHKELCHGSYNYHNVILSGSSVSVTNFDKVRNECQVWDLYQFMRKVLEKYDWDIHTAYKLIDEYDKVKKISDSDLKLLGALFCFPEKFWKVINHYFNMNKAWIPPKSIEKLKIVIEQNYKRKEFIKTLC